MDKFEILCMLRAISGYAYDIHYTAKGKFFYSDHIFSERLADVDVEDDLIETMYLGESQEAPNSTEINTKVISLTPEISEDTDTNFKRLRDMIVSALIGIEQYIPKTKAEDDILGSIAHILQRHNGLLFRQLRYDTKELANDKWITVHPNPSGKGHPLLIKDGETVEQAIERKYKQKDLFGKKTDLGKSPKAGEESKKATLQEKIRKELKKEDDYNTSGASWSKLSKAEEEYINLFGKEDYDKVVEDYDKEAEEAKKDKEQKEKYRDYLYEHFSEKSRAIYDRAQKYERAITKDITEEAKKQGVSNIGLDFRKKKIDRVVEKAREDVKEGKWKDFDEAMDNIYDMVRYTQSGTVDNLVDTATKTLKNLEEKGYKIKKIKNFFLDESNPYCGVNVQMISPSKVKLELQFNTNKNADVKEKMHKIYEKSRQSNITDEDKAKYEKQMWKLNPLYEIPKGIEKLTEKLLTNS